MRGQLRCLCSCSLTVITSHRRCLPTFRRPSKQCEQETSPPASAPPSTGRWRDWRLSRGKFVLRKKTGTGGARMRLWNCSASGPHRRFSGARLRQHVTGKKRISPLAWACNRLIPFHRNPARCGFLQRAHLALQRTNALERCGHDRGGVGWQWASPATLLMPVVHIAHRANSVRNTEAARANSPAGRTSVTGTEGAASIASNAAAAIRAEASRWARQAVRSSTCR